MGIKSLNHSLELMDIQIVSDLHLEVPKNARYFQQGRIIPRANILILAGDTMCWDEDYLENDFWDKLSSEFSQVLVIPGNHEFYKGYDLSLLKQNRSNSIRSNIHWYYNHSIIIDGVQIILSTLWSHIPLDISERISNCGNDFTCIKYEGIPITIDKYNDENLICIDYITKEMLKKYSKRIVVSHHAPIWEALPDQLRHSWYAPLYANNLYDLIKNNTIDYWIYGHSHQNVEPFLINNTTFISNPCGYLSKKENTLFDSNRVISI